MNKTSISYADFTWNPFLGCSRISAGCGDSHGGGCYAERLASTRLAHLPAYQGLTANGRWNWTVRMLPERLDEPLRRRKPAVIFVGDMGDLFHPNLPFDYVAAIFGVMAACPQHTFLTLTKRPERMVEFDRWAEGKFCQYGGVECDVPDALIYWLADSQRHLNKRIAASSPPWPLPNWWAGVTVENQREADRRIPLLLKTPAAHRWVSAEPLLEAVRLDDIKRGNERFSALSCDVDQEDDDFGGAVINQLIVGGESGPGARPCDVEWIRSLRDQCAEAGTKFYVKQLGSHAVEPCSSCNGGKDRFDDGGPFGPCCTDCQNTDYEHFRGRDSHGADPAEWPADLRARELGWRT